MADVCVSEDFTVDGAGQLSIAAHTRMSHVSTLSAAPVSRRKTWSEIALPGDRMWFLQSQVVNTSPVDRPVMFRLNRPYVFLSPAQPNAIQLRDKWETEVGASPIAPAVDVTESYNGVWTASVDSGPPGGSPQRGRTFPYWPGVMVAETVMVPAGESAVLSWAGYVWTPPPWSNNANEGNEDCWYECGQPFVSSWLLPGVAS